MYSEYGYLVVNNGMLSKQRTIQPLSAQHTPFRH